MRKSCNNVLLKQNTLLRYVNSANFTSKSLLTLLSALVPKIWRERKQKAKTLLTHLNLKDGVASSISKASILVRCCKTGSPFIFHPRLHNRTCLSKYVNNANMLLITYENWITYENSMQIRNYSSSTKNFRSWLRRDNKTSYCRFTILLNSSERNKYIKNCFLKHNFFH